MERDGEGRERERLKECVFDGEVIEKRGKERKDGERLYI